MDYPLTIDIARCNEIDVVRTNIVMLKHMIGVIGAAVAILFNGLESVYYFKDISSAVHILVLYTFWISFGYVHVLQRDCISFLDVVRVKRNRVIEALLLNKGHIGTEQGGSFWNYHRSRGSVDLGPLSVEDAAITARMCLIDNQSLVALDLCSPRFFQSQGNVDLAENILSFRPGEWNMNLSILDSFGEWNMQIL